MSETLTKKRKMDFRVGVVCNKRLLYRVLFACSLPRKVRRTAQCKVFAYWRCTLRLGIIQLLKHNIFLINIYIYIYLLIYMLK